MRMASVPVKCRKCRQELFSHPTVRLQDSHGVGISEEGRTDSECSSEVLYIPEETKPSWLEEILDERGWEKGKINCPKCSARIGSYNFVSGMKCQCGTFVLPPIHIVKSKIDFVPEVSL
jgi:DNA-directed RNA polymerase subunit RPC12/RpoP